jgi:hypothetical protein
MSQVQYFINGFGIDEDFITSSIQLYLGPDATATPYRMDVRLQNILRHHIDPIAATRLSDHSILSPHGGMSAAGQASN